MPILNYTTKIDAYTTIGEIQKMLAKAGATKMIIDNDTEGRPDSVTFCIPWKDTSLAFTLPCNFQGVMKSMEKNKKVIRSMCTEDQAMRTGWRILKDWIEAQLAIVEAEMASMAEVFLPYAVTKDGTTLFKRFENDSKLLLYGK